jgi:DNA-directed RNA polymerase subunit M/transcription elongation factor TFIIS
MRFCPTCDSVMARSASAGYIIFKCRCGAEMKGDPEDARVSGALVGAVETPELFGRLISGAASDRVNQLVLKPPCVECGLDYQTQIRLGKSEVVIYRCKCGAETVGGADPVQLHQK